MHQLIQFLIGGVVAGGLYAVLASGLVLTYSTSGVFNFAYGAIAFVVAALYYELNTGLHWPVVWAALMSICVFAPLIGFALYHLMFKRLSRANETAQIVATIGLLIALPAAAVWLVGIIRSVGGAHIASLANVASPPGIGPDPAGIFHVFGRVVVTTDQLAILAAAVVGGAALWVLVRATPLGLRMRATVDRRELAAMRGVDPDRTSLVAWMTATLLAGLIGVLAAPSISLNANGFTSLMLVSAAAAIFAGLRSIPLAFVFGLGLGIVQDLVAGYAEPHLGAQIGLSSAVPFILLFAGLLFLSRRRIRSTGTASEERPPPEAVNRDGRPRWAGAAPWAVAVVALLVYLLFIGDSYWVGLFTAGLCLALVFLSFVVVTGLGGMVSLAQATFVTAAGISAGWAFAHHAPFLVALLLGTAVACAVGMLMSGPAVRLGGVPLALATLALAYVGSDLVFQLNAATNSSLGWTIPRPALGALHFDSGRPMALLALVLVGLVVLLIRNLQRSAWGRAMLAVRSTAPAAAASGVSPARVKFALFAVSAAIAGFGGVLYASYSGLVAPGNFPPEIGLVWLAVVVTYGVRRPGYAVLAGVFYALFPQILSYVTTSTELPQILFGLGGVALARNPDGFIADMKIGVARLRQRRRLSAATAGPEPTTPEPVASEPVASPAASTAAARTRPRPAGPAARRPQPAEAAVLELHDVRVAYDGVEVLHHVDVAVAAGSIMALVGPNGAGKSSLCSAAAGLVTPTAGTIRLGGVDLTGVAAHQRARLGLQLAPEGRGIFAALTVEENLRLSLPHAADRSAAYDRFAPLAERRNLPAGVLSGGEQQMLALAPALVRPPRVLVADEPSLGLAPLVVEQIHQLFGELRKTGTAVVVVEERLHELLPVVDQVVVLDLGRVAWAGPAAAVDDEQLKEIYLGTSGGGLPAQSAPSA